MKGQGRRLCHPVGVNMVDVGKKPDCKVAVPIGGGHGETVVEVLDVGRGCMCFKSRLLSDDRICAMHG